MCQKEATACGLKRLNVDAGGNALTSSNAPAFATICCILRPSEAPHQTTALREFTPRDCLARRRVIARHGRTLFIIPARADREMVRRTAALLSAGADFRMRSSDGLNAFDIGVESNSVAAVEALLTSQQPSVFLWFTPLRFRSV